MFGELLQTHPLIRGVLAERSVSHLPSRCDVSRQRRKSRRKHAGTAKELGGHLSRFLIKRTTVFLAFLATSPFGLHFQITT